MRIKLIGAALAFSLLPGGAFAQSELYDGQVQRIDEAQSRVMLRHGPIKKLDMEPMTMMFRVKEPSMLTGIKVGDRVKFDVERIDGQITIIKLEKAK